MIALPSEISAKVAWAVRHFYEMSQRLVTYYEAQPFEIDAEIVEELADRDEGMDWWVPVGRVKTVPPVEIALLASDVVQNLRSSLDYLARALVLTSGGSPHDGVGGTQFPIRDTPPKGSLRLAGCSNPEIVRQLTELQPYRFDDPDDHPLRRLNSLNNRSKHQLLPVVVGGGDIPGAVALHDNAGSGAVTAYLRWWFDSDRLEPLLFPLKTGTKPVVESIIEPIATLDADPWNTVGLGEEMEFLINYVRHYVFPSFRRFFAEPWPEEFSAEPLVDPSEALPLVDPADFTDITLQILGKVPRREGKKPYLVAPVAGKTIALGYATGGAPRERG